METTITRIADLPIDNNSLQSSNTLYSSTPPTAISISKQKQNANDTESPSNYMPINIHPNPYGVSDKNPIMETRQSSAMSNMDPYSLHSQSHSHSHSQSQFIQPTTQLSHEQIEQLNRTGQQRLPSRDIAQDQSRYLHDNEVHANFIPKPPPQSDFVREHYELTEKRLQEYEDKKRRESRVDWLLTEIQTPALIAILFFFFQLPLINTMIFKRFSFLALYDVDGNFNLFGLTLKSALFGIVFHSLRSIMNFLSEI
jgi:hypothetical protein